LFIYCSSIANPLLLSFITYSSVQLVVMFAADSNVLNVAIGVIVVAFAIFYKLNFSSFATFKGCIVYCRSMGAMIGYMLFKLYPLQNKKASFADHMEKIVDKSPNLVQFITVEDGKEYTLRDIDQCANQVAQWAISIGVSCGDTLGLFMSNR
jgi:hypothetical protein